MACKLPHELPSNIIRLRNLGNIRKTSILSLSPLCLPETNCSKYFLLDYRTKIKINLKLLHMRLGLQ